MPLRDLAFSFQYRSDHHVIARDLYARCLPQSSLFLRAVGFFSGTVFTACSSAFYDFFRSNGRMRIVCSPLLSRSDIDAFHRGFRDRPAIAKNKTYIEILNREQPGLQSGLADLLAWLVASGRLELKIAVLANQSVREIYHEKLGLFVDDNGDRVAFTGSANESRAALRENFELVDLFRSWEPSESRRVARKSLDFQLLWDAQTPGLEIYSFPEAARAGLLRVRTSQHSSGNLGEIETLPPVIEPLPGLEETLGVPSDITLRRHQLRAVGEWFAHGGRGILEMATGSGKTITALSAAAKLYEQIDAPLVIIIVCPYLHLLTQWGAEARRFGLDPLPCALSRSRWHEDLSIRLYNTSVGKRSITSVVTTNATFTSVAFQTHLGRLAIPILLIVDEVHNIGAEESQNALPPNAKYRMGLSATPERWFDPTGTDALTDYFGPTLVHYTLREALADGVLCPYRYYPQLVQLTDEEFDEYYELTLKIARELGQDSKLEASSSERLEALLIRRARLVATARGKLETLGALLTPLRGSIRNLIYCGDGTVEMPAEQTVERQIEAVTRMLGRDMGMMVAKYTAETTLGRRDTLRRQFALGEIQGLVAIRCLDEGVDIPETQRAFILASSTNPRQFIQRRGRLLRRSPGKEMADIYDFIVVPPEEFTQPKSPYYSITRSLFGKELIRVLEFAGLAVNGPEALGPLLPLRDRLNLLALGTEEEHARS